MSPAVTPLVGHASCALCVCVCVKDPTSARQVPAGVLGVLSVPDGGADGADQSHDQQDAEQDQDLHVGDPLHVGALQRRLGGVLERGTGRSVSGGTFAT